MNPLWFWAVKEPWRSPYMREFWCAPLNWPRPLGYAGWYPEWYDRGRIVVGSRTREQLWLIKQLRGKADVERVWSTMVGLAR